MMTEIRNMLRPLCVVTLISFILYISHLSNKFIIFRCFCRDSKDILSSNFVGQVQEKSSLSSQILLQFHLTLSLRTPKSQKAISQTSVTLAPSVERYLTDHQSSRGIKPYTEGSQRLYINVSSVIRASSKKRS